MLELISRIVDISSHRDRTEINAAMTEAILSLFHPQQLVIYQCYASGRKHAVFPCAGLAPNGKFVRNAYLPERRLCHGLEHDPLLNRCRKEMSAVLDIQDDGSHRIVFPVIRLDEPIYLIDLTLTDEFSADQRVMLMGLVEYFGNHIALLDYGEADTLTGLSSRKTFDKHLFELLAKPARDEENQTGQKRRGAASGPYWLAVCDIDHFKLVNDNFGHLIGDEVLIMLAQVMRQTFRFDDQLFRFGGEEFIILLQPATEASAFATLERFREEVAQANFSRVGNVTISIGFSALQTGDTPTDVIDRADEALYFAKRNGRNRSACYEQLVAARQLTEKVVVRGEVELF